MGAITIKQIAEMANVSRGTVDRVLNNRGGVSKEVADRVNMVAETLGYKPNSAGKALAVMKKKISFGVILPSPEDNPFFVDIVRGIDFAGKNIESYGIKLLYRFMRTYSTELQLGLIDELVSQGVTALIIMPFDDEAIIEKINTLVDSGILVVTMNNDICDSKRNYHVGIDFIKSGKIAAGLLGQITNGRANVLVLNGSAKLLGHKQRIMGFHEVIDELYPEIKVVDIIDCNDNNFVAYDLVLASLKMYPEIDAIYITAEGITGACEAVAKYPDRLIKIICFDDVPKVKELIRSGRISATVCQQPFNQGSTAVDKLFASVVNSCRNTNEIIYMDSIIKIRENID